MIKLDAWERANMISVLEWRTRFSYEYMNSLSDEELYKLYEDRVIDWQKQNLSKKGETHGEITEGQRRKR